MLLNDPRVLDTGDSDVAWRVSRIDVEENHRRVDATNVNATNIELRDDIESYPAHFCRAATVVECKSPGQVVWQHSGVKSYHWFSARLVSHAVLNS